jgi:hypothetical protein
VCKKQLTESYPRHHKNRKNAKHVMYTVFYLKRASRVGRPVHVGRERRGQRNHNRRQHDEQLAVALLLALVRNLLPAYQNIELSCVSSLR